MPPAAPGGSGPCAHTCARTPPGTRGHVATAPCAELPVARGDDGGTRPSVPARRASVSCEPRRTGCAKPPLRGPRRPSRTARARGQARGRGGGTGRAGVARRSGRPKVRAGGWWGWGGGGGPSPPIGGTGTGNDPTAWDMRARGCAAPLALCSFGSPGCPPTPFSPHPQLAASPRRPPQLQPTSPRPTSSLACALPRGPGVPRSLPAALSREPAPQSC